MVTLVPQDRVQPRTVEQIIQVLIAQTMEEILKGCLDCPEDLRTESDSKLQLETVPSSATESRVPYGPQPQVVGYRQALRRR